MVRPQKQLWVLSVERIFAIKNESFVFISTMSYYLPVASKENFGVKYFKIIAHSKEVIKTPVQWEKKTKKQKELILIPSPSKKL